MGFVRGGLLVVVSVLFFIGLLIATLFYTVQSSIQYDNVKENLPKVINDVLGSKFNATNLINDSKLAEVKRYCSNNSYFDVGKGFEEANIYINISCESIQQGNQAIIDEVIGEAIDQAYYRDYDCQLTKCLEDNSKVFYVVSQDFQSYLLSKFYLIFIILIVLFILMFLLAENKANAFLIGGILIIVSALPFLKIKSLISSLNGEVFKFVGLLFSSSNVVFIKVLVIGIVFLLVGIVLKFFDIGFKISAFFDKFRKEKKIEESVSKDEVKEIIKKEVAKAKDESKKKPDAKKSPKAPNKN